MARKPRVHFTGALYHVMCRGNQGQAIFTDDKDRRFYLNSLTLARRARRQWQWGVYRVNFTANDGHGGVCSGSVNVTVPKSMHPENAAVDDGQSYDSTLS